MLELAVHMQSTSTVFVFSYYLKTVMVLGLK